jgi:hypothetical protein
MCTMRIIDAIWLDYEYYVYVETTCKSVKDGGGSAFVCGGRRVARHRAGGIYSRYTFVSDIW